ncbi:TetR/AcrR family transcriptional regulator C-terminal domain-containing protein [Bradyrhizobium sp. AUGA SZCCT0431]|uniref:TetR/AcrR family transcriptional regulator n=1 Tax=Bradyrhizobium sp. AUGA SZCCT0431 TaxID=2807674 RepID=UPI001BA71EE1|nr:TetR/AcrR family transcriptional regulator C-terminal domain-containing protein [Bradyrhizobium sp. AUGA SZCCT0431]MBR1146767.1 TetR/AcrR family transcriptional regulator C-terminal domain-containing protein [Bradyrhizobium sp. AUGA SZCCT0431]
MRRPASARSDNAESRPDVRSDIVSAISEALAHPGDASAGLNSIFHRSGYSEKDIWSTFESVDDLVVAVAEHEAFFISQPLVRRARPTTLDDVRDTLVAFGLVASREYSTTLVGFIRMMMAEGARNPSLKKRLYEAGSEIVTRRLREFLSEANERGILSISDAQVCAEQLMGLLREPLYQALMLNPLTSQNGTTADRVKASVERFLHGCASAGSARYERAI